MGVDVVGDPFFFQHRRDAFDECPLRVGGKPECRYVHLLREVTDDVAAKRCQLAVLVPPAGMSDVEQIAGNLEKMPPKSTYFYPKLLSGMTIYKL